MTPRAALETTAVVLTGVLHFVFYHVLSARGLFIAITVLAWFSYFAIRVYRNPGNLRLYGLTRQGLQQSTRAAILVLMTGVAACFVVGVAQGSIRFVPHMAVLALLYPVWGLVQQVLVQAMVVRNLRGVLPPPVLVCLAAILFGLIHLPDLRLAIATALLGSALTVIFLRWQNVWPLGVCHGFLGVFFYFWVLERDPWMEIFNGG